VRSGAAGHGGGTVVRGGGVAVPRTHPPYSSPYYRPYYAHGYYRPYYYHPYYAGYYPYYYSPFSFSLSLGFGYGAAYYPYYAYPSYYGYPYAPYPYAYSAPYPYPSQSPSAPQAPYPSANNGYQPDERGTTTAGGEFGTLSLRVMPADATILIDGQAWDRPRGDERFSIELVAGPHEVEVRKTGYSTYTRTIDVPRGQPIVWNVALTPGGTGTMQVVRRTIPLRH
jgi:hypothetical protein